MYSKKRKGTARYTDVVTDKRQGTERLIALNRHSEKEREREEPLLNRFY